jgi:hypothetical protein
MLLQAIQEQAAWEWARSPAMTQNIMDAKQAMEATPT